MNSPRSRIDEINNAPISALTVKERGKTVSQIWPRADQSVTSIDARDDADARSVSSRCGTHFQAISLSSVTISKSSLHDDASISSRVTKDQVQREEALASSLSAASQRSGSSRKPRTYADEYLRAALTPTTTRTRKSLDPTFPSSVAAVGEEEPPEITSIPTDEIVDANTSPFQDLEEKAQVDETLMRGSHETVVRSSRDLYTVGRLHARATKRRELLNKVDEEEEEVRNFRRERLRNVRQLYVKVEEESDSLGNGGGMVGKPVSSPSNRSEPGSLSNGRGRSGTRSPSNRSGRSAVRSPTNNAGTVGAAGSVPSPTNARAVGSPKIQSMKSGRASPENNVSAAGSPTSMKCCTLNPEKNTMSPANNASAVPASIKSGRHGNSSLTDNTSVTNAVSTTVKDTINSPNNNSVASPSNQSAVSRKSSISSSKSDEVSEYRMQLFAKMLHLLDDVNHPKMDGSATKDSRNSERSHEYSVAELKLIQKRTEEEMSRILNEFDRNKRNKLRAAKKKAGLKEVTQNGDQDLDSEDEKGPPPDKIMLPEVIASKLSDITSPTACQDGSGVYLDDTPNNYYCVVTNEYDLSPRILPPRHSSPRKKKVVPFFDLPIVQENLPIVQENSEGLEEHYKSVTDDTIYEQQSAKVGVNKSLPQSLADSITNSTDSSPQDEFNRAAVSDNTLQDELDWADEDEPGVMFSNKTAMDELLAASRGAARRTVKRERKKEEDLFHEGIMNAVSAAEEMQRLDGDLMDEVYDLDESFDRNPPGLESMNDPSFLEGASVQETVDAGQEGLNQEESNLEDRSQDPFGNQNELNIPTHEQCGCLIQ